MSEDPFEPSVMQGRADSSVQQAAGAMALPRSGTKRRVIYEAVLASRWLGVTFDDLQTMTGWEYSDLGPRMRELRGAKIHKSNPPRYFPVLVVDSGRTRKGDAGADQVVWTAIAFAPRRRRSPLASRTRAAVHEPLSRR